MLAKFKSKLLSSRTKLREKEEEMETEGKVGEGEVEGETVESVAEKPESSWWVGVPMVTDVLPLLLCTTMTKFSSAIKPLHTSLIRMGCGLETFKCIHVCVWGGGEGGHLGRVFISV